MQAIEAAARPSMAGRSTRNVWLLAPLAAWVMLVLVSVTLFVLGLQQRQKDLRELYWGGIQAYPSQSPGRNVTVSVARFGAAVRAGVLEGDVLLAINDAPVASAADANARLDEAAGRPVKLTLRTGNHASRTYTIEPLGSAGLVLHDMGISSQFVVSVVLLFELLFGLVSLGVGAFIFIKRRTDWLALLVSASMVVWLLGTSVAAISLVPSRQDLFKAFNAWQSLAVVLFLLSFYLFPDGRFEPRWTAVLALLVALLLLPGLSNYAWYPWYLSPSVQVPLLIVILGSGPAALFYRYRFAAGAEQRQQIRWVALGAAALTAGTLLEVFPLSTGAQLQGGTRVVYDLVLFPIGQVLRVLLPVSIAIAILRHHLWDITLVVNRTLVYAGLTFGVILLYAAVVAVVGSLFQTTSNVASLAAAAAVAFAFQPLRTRLQTAVNRLMYGERGNPYAVVGRLGRRLESALAPEAVLPTLVETVGQALKLPYVAVYGQDGSTGGAGVAIEAAYGEPAPLAVDLPLHYQGETVGRLAAAAREPGGSLDHADVNLLSTIASQAGAAVHAVQLNAALQQSRQRLVAAREEERRRIRRDLHDGLGPALAAMAMEADAARDAVASQPDEAAALLEDITTKAQAALRDIRRLVYDLRPPALDELGLAGAIRQHASAYAASVRVEITAAESVNALPAAVEVAAYRIAVEALNNVVQHAQASRCAITIGRTLGPRDALTLEVRDDGAGLTPGHKFGVGLVSMRERAAELGGSCTIEPAPGKGTIMTACLPLPAHSESP